MRNFDMYSCGGGNGEKIKNNDNITQKEKDMAFDSYLDEPIKGEPIKKVDNKDFVLSESTDKVIDLYLKTLDEVDLNLNNIKEMDEKRLVHVFKSIMEADSISK